MNLCTELIATSPYRFTFFTYTLAVQACQVCEELLFFSTSQFSVLHNILLKLNICELHPDWYHSWHGC